MFKLKQGLFLLIVLLLMGGCTKTKEVVEQSTTGDSVVTIQFPSERYPETAEHIREAISQGQPSTCTIDREHAKDHRTESLEGIPTKKGKDRDEWPMAMCAEGGAGADVRYVKPSDNRGAGAWIKNKLKKYKNGTKVQFVIP